MYLSILAVYLYYYDVFSSVSTDHVSSGDCLEDHLWRAHVNASREEFWGEVGRRHHHQNSGSAHDL